MLELARREVELEKMQRLEHERFLSMLTHELKTPISIAKINLSLSGIQGKEQERIARALKNMADVVERCNISAAIEEKRLTIQPESFNVRQVLDDLIGLWDAQDRVKFSEVKHLVHRTDCQLFTIVVSNLLDNALKYSAPRSSILIAYGHKTVGGQNGVQVVVSNQIAPGTAPDPTRIYTKYYRSKSAERKSGSGLGLYISLGIAQVLGGTLHHQNSQNLWAFEFWSPILE